jgi:hypothetical protein
MLAAILLALTAFPASATTLIRASLEEIVSSNAIIIVGRVVDTRSRWNDQGTFILTDVTIAPTEVLKGTSRSGPLTVTILGGSVGNLTTLIIGGPTLLPGNSYLLFLNPEELPGATGALAVRDLCQGAFDIKQDRVEMRAISQAIGHPLLPDASGHTEPAGGAQGVPLSVMAQTIRQLVAREVK